MSTGVAQLGLLSVCSVQGATNEHCWPQQGRSRSLPYHRLATSSSSHRGASQLLQLLWRPTHCSTNKSPWSRL